VDRRDDSSSLVFASHHAAAWPVARFLRTEDLLRDAETVAAASSAAPDEFSPPGSYTPLILLNSPTGNPKRKES